MADLQLRDFGPLVGVLLALAACDAGAIATAVEAGLARRLAGVLTVEPWEGDGGPYRVAAAELASKVRECLNDITSRKSHREVLPCTLHKGLNCAAGPTCLEHDSVTATCCLRSRMKRCTGKCMSWACSFMP